MTERRGLFISFEGMDGCGKTTQMRRLAERLRQNGHTVIETAEPGGTIIGQAIRRILLDPAHQELSPTAELLLYFASRAQNVDQQILPALERGDIVLCDRFTDSTLVYQGAGRGLGSDVVLTLEKIACRGLSPDITIYLDIDLETSLARAQARNRTGTANESRLDDEAVDFHRRVREEYRQLAARETRRFRVIDARGSMDTVEQAVWAAVESHFAGVPDPRRMGYVPAK